MNSGLPKLIFAIASTQKTANLAPIVHLARPKSGDRVLWLNSGRAVSGAWTEGVDAVLDARNIGRLEPIAFSDAASEVYDSVSQGLASRHDLQGFSPWLVFNGGSKTMPAQIDQAIRDRFGGRTVCFSDVNSAVLTVWGQDWRAGRREQMGACLRLEEILRCNGYQPTGAAPRSLMPGSDPVALICPGYAEETDATDAVHTRMERSIASFSPIELPKYHHLDDDAKEDWSRALGRVFDPARGYLRRGRPNWTEPNCLTPNEASRTALFNGAIKLAKQNIAQSRSETPGPPPPKVGDIFEAAVARRVQAWLAANAGACGVCEAWTGCSVCRTGSPSNETDLDVVLVLRNGTVLNLECKANAEPGLGADIHAKRSRANLYASIGSGLVIVYPVYSGLAEQSWFVAYMEQRRRMKEDRFELIDFTLPGQPEAFVWTDSAGVECVERIRPFEQALAARLAPFRTDTW